MKRILITGANSYIGTSFENYMAQFGSEYQIDTIDVRGDSWKQIDFDQYDSIVHLAAIVHVKEKDESAYFRINCDLAVEVAKKAKKDKVKQFIYFSSMSVYGLNIGSIDVDTKENPRTPYAKSKLQAEHSLNELNDRYFNISIVRPPMVYGERAKGNYDKIIKLARVNPFFPSIRNKRSMISITNLCSFIKFIIDNSVKGILFPQNEEYVCTAFMYQKIREELKKDTYYISVFNPIIKFLSLRIQIFGKVFGDLTYSYRLPGNPISEKYVVEKSENTFKVK